MLGNISKHFYAILQPYGCATIDETFYVTTSIMKSASVTKSIIF